MANQQMIANGIMEKQFSELKRRNDMLEKEIKSKKCELKISLFFNFLMLVSAIIGIFI
ncbi:MAG: hypothetical protein PHX09_03985 [Clostridia bacterium]|nr:hypothetical protein [Clostridia bacterium]